MKKGIYIYTDGKNFKVGKADQRSNQSNDITIEEICDNRIKEQQTAATYGEITAVNVFDITSADSSTAVEHYIHNKLELMGFDRLERKYKDHNGTTEWFDFGTKDENIPNDIVGKLITEIVGASGRVEFTPYAHQAWIEAMVLDKVDEGEKVIGVELAPRFGKTLWALSTFKKLVNDFNYQYMFLPAYVLTAHSSFMKELRSFSNFDDVMFVSDTDSDFEDKIKNNKDKQLVIAVSLHTPEDNFSKYDCFKELDNDKKVSFVDEADFGAHTDNSKRIMELLGCDLKILMTGTAIERAVAGYDVGGVIQCSYADMLAIQNDTHPMLDELLG